MGPPTRPPQFAIVRHVTAGVSKIDVLNLDHIVHVVAHAYEEQIAIEMFTTDKPDPIFTGAAAANILAHLILCGIDVEGAPAALARARGDLYAPYFKATRDAGDRFDEEGGSCANLTPPPPPPTPNDADECPHVKGCEHWRRGLGCTVPDFNECPKLNDAPAPPISVEEHAAELREMRAKDRTPEAHYRVTGNGPICRACGLRHAGDRCLPPRRGRGAPRPTAEELEQAYAADEGRAAERACALAPAELQAGKVAADVLGQLDDDRATAVYEDTRRSCAFGDACKRFPACGDCSLYALDRACESLHRGERIDEDADERRKVHVEHVEQVSGETSAALVARVERCSVFAGMKKAGVVPGDKWCGVGHEMTDPACALCPYLRIYAPTL